MIATYPLSYTLLEDIHLFIRYININVHVNVYGILLIRINQ